MGLIVNVYRDAHPHKTDCTNGGVSSRHHQLTVMNASGPFEPNDTAPPVLIRKGPYGTLNVVPAVLSDKGHWVEAPGWFMMGGNYAATSDSRFGEACERLGGQRFPGALPIHDRQE